MAEKPMKSVAVILIVPLLFSAFAESAAGGQSFRFRRGYGGQDGRQARPIVLQRCFFVNSQGRIVKDYPSIFGTVIF
jgi:hypothetical protein